MRRGRKATGQVSDLAARLPEEEWNKGYSPHWWNKGAAPHRREVVLIVPERRSPMMNHIMRFVREEEGATALEYGLVAALIAAAIIGAVTALGTSVSNTFANL